MQEMYYLMHKDIVVAKVTQNSIEIINKDLVPIFFLKYNSFEDWLKSRVIDKHRTNSRLLKKVLRLASYNDVKIALAAKAITITDNYWVKLPEEHINYAEVRFKLNLFSDLALTGSYDEFNTLSQQSFKEPYTPELTNIGSYEKCWKLINNKWHLFKKANDREAFSELFTYQLGKSLGLNMAEYSYKTGCVITKDFTNNASVDFEPAFDFMWDNDNYLDNIKVLKDLTGDKLLVYDYLKIIFLDTLVGNPDRHTFNYGVLRDSDTGQIISMAPNFDNNLALWSKNDFINTKREHDIMVSEFNKCLDYVPEFKKEIPKITKVFIDSLLAAYDIPNEIKSKVSDFIYNGYLQLKLSDNNKTSFFMKK